MATILNKLNGPAILINSMPDHIHILFKLNRTISVAKAVEEVKKGSSKWIKTQGPQYEKFAWQAGYGTFSVSESHAGKVANYIRNQEEHHRHTSFQDEYRSFLAKHNMDYNEPYVWD